MENHGGPISVALFSPEGQQLASASGDKTIRIWDVKTGERLRTFNGHDKWISSISFSPTDRQLVSAYLEESVRLWYVDTGEELRKFKIHSPDGQLLALASNDRTVRLWNARTGDELHIFEGHNLRVNTVAFSPDGQQLASASEDKTAQLWHIRMKTAQNKLIIEAVIKLLQFRDRSILETDRGLLETRYFSPDTTLSRSQPNTFSLFVKREWVLKKHGGLSLAFSREPGNLCSCLRRYPFLRSFV